MPFLSLALSFISANWKPLAIAAAALAVAGWVLGTQAEIGHLKKSLATEQAANTQLAAANATEHQAVLTLLGANATNQRVCTLAEAGALQNLTIAKSEAAAAQARAANYGKILNVIQAAPADASPVSPVVRGAFDGLYDAP